MSETVDKAVYDEVLARARRAERKCRELIDKCRQLEADVWEMRTQRHRLVQLDAKQKAMRELFGS